MNKPLRRCVACREMKEKNQLVKLAASDEIFIDTSGKAPGRGAYVCRNAKCVERAHKTKGFERSLKRPIPFEIYEQLRDAILESRGG